MTAGSTSGVNLGGFAFPAIPFSVPAGQSLILYTTDTAQTNACSSEVTPPVGTLRGSVTAGQPVIAVACLSTVIIDQDTPVAGGRLAP